ncbi:hypothetical protein GUITHDRAFT_155851 [Guillardia theta CCMP2712]|uniref:Uncharacterized protein n=1 Tax=Guillardia theta (strain CCMP2712) TaxID=905079 RepID=L1IDP2_GUITC|nr:hypothetical protein GUITHDRAFT_155851 [Guillardia theta CCMP2712]EKX34029.1 hypothetical protein GUITHDRAFT_155851 [Guillardia theta CCMP2712]|eukprot:XP_005821009.1 hypothetical protein GUITHDRAFT_155851 [Guillardia theta CCMP2712]
MFPCLEVDVPRRILQAHVIPTKFIPICIRRIGLATEATLVLISNATVACHV